jgi:hypothetical protein
VDGRIRRRVELGKHHRACSAPALPTAQFRAGQPYTSEELQQRAFRVDLLIGEGELPAVHEERQAAREIIHCELFSCGFNALEGGIGWGEGDRVDLPTQPKVARELKSMTGSYGRKCFFLLHERTVFRTLALPKIWIFFG